MAQHYDPWKVLRQVSNELLKQFFGKLKLHVDVEWDKIGQTEIEPIFQAWEGASKTPARGLVEGRVKCLHWIAGLFAWLPLAAA